MEKQQGNYDTVVAEVMTYFRERLHRTDETIRRYRYIYRRIKEYMDIGGTLQLDEQVCRDYLLHRFESLKFNELNDAEKLEFNTVFKLIEFMETGVIHTSRERVDLEGPIGVLMQRYIEYKVNQRMHPKNIHCFKRHLSRFLHYLKGKHIDTCEALDLSVVMGYINVSGPNHTLCVMDLALRTLKDFFRYLYDQKIHQRNLSSMLPKTNYKNQPKLPSTYTAEEVEKVIGSIDRRNPYGKRDLAMILLASRLGLRVSDIAGLKFEHLLWEQGMIRLVQAKTDNEIELPLLPEVGNAIIDYLKYGKREYDGPFVFLNGRGTASTTPVAVSSVVQRAFSKSGVKTNGKRHGAHSLRHSLAGRLLEQHTNLNVISQVLGHSGTESSKYYLRVDVQSMMKCVLDVSAVPLSFYSQKGGVFYV